MSQNQVEKMVEEPEPTESRARWIDTHRLYQHLLHLHNMQAITPDQYKTLYKQINSRDEENLVVAQESIAQLISSL